MTLLVRSDDHDEPNQKGPNMTLLLKIERHQGPWESQAADGPRTRDLKLGKLALYQLSYHRARADITPLDRSWTLMSASAAGADRSWDAGR
jgi:hypothetical protein